MTKNALAPIIKAERMLAEAKTLDEILHVENLAQRARDFAKAAGMGRDAANTATKVMLDARRKAGWTLRTMQERGELAARGDRKCTSVGHLTTLEDLGLTRNQSSRYQQEESVPEKKYLGWVKKVRESKSGELSAAGLRSVARETSNKPKPKPKKRPFRTVAARLRQAVARAYESLSEQERQILPPLLRDIAEEYEERIGG